MVNVGKYGSPMDPMSSFLLTFLNNAWCVVGVDFLPFASFHSFF